MSNAETRTPFTRKGFIFGAVLVGVLVLAGILIAFTSLGRGGGSTASSAAPSTPEPSATPTVDSAAASVCGLAGYEESGTLSAAPDTEWTIVGTMAAPGRGDVGPGVTGDDGVRSCYAHTVEGALFATANLWAMGSNASLSRAVTEQLVVPGPGRDAALATEYGTSNNGVSVQIAGFKVLSYTGDRATIDTAFTLNNGTLSSGAQELQWSDGDWKVVLTDDGQPSYRPVALQSLGGYVIWGGVQ
ncbi:hypothetical protein GRS96_20195 (plasmid) [Rathayibacter sp. VKM Ac-2803]|uniref:hypothetical protein n=1 Tax=Rathayibacter sp. VKM Ac-2803 TaxID=2609256 RepID=UPI001357C7D8|nr:hypothetical protein [Rathayibacter sp. VKM Ac-2803]MWV51589.1 hypothetical protein [Rathayibacter sp. VKM Ac-2803]